MHRTASSMFSTLNSECPEIWRKIAFGAGLLRLAPLFPKGTRGAGIPVARGQLNLLSARGILSQIRLNRTWIDRLQRNCKSFTLQVYYVSGNHFQEQTWPAARHSLQCCSILQIGKRQVPSGTRKRHCSFKPSI
jgi:hypothetical protein